MRRKLKSSISENFVNLRTEIEIFDFQFSIIDFPFEKHIYLIVLNGNANCRSTKLKFR